MASRRSTPVAWFVNRHLARRASRLLDDLDCALQDHVEGKPAVSFPEEYVSGRDRTHVAPGAKCVYVGPAQPGEGDIMFGWHVPVIANLSKVRTPHVCEQDSPGR